MSRKRHRAGPVTVHRLGAEPEIMPATAFRHDAVATIVDDPPRLLARGHARRRGDDGDESADLGYTSVLALALSDEPEALSEDEQKHYAAVAGREQRQAADAAATAILAAMTADLERLRSLIPGDHRGFFREIDHGLRGLADAMK